MTAVPLMKKVMTDDGDLVVAGASGVAGRLPLGAEGDVLTVVSAAADWAPPPSPAGGSMVDFALSRYTGGNITVTGSTPAALSGPSDLAVSAAAGDLLDFTLMAISDSDPDQIRFDVATIVSGSAVNFFSSLSGTAATTGIMGWLGYGSQILVVSGKVRYVVQSGDISAGIVTLRLYAWINSGASRTVRATSGGDPIIYSVVNLGQ